jgi:hypothetical protein
MSGLLIGAVLVICVGLFVAYRSKCKEVEQCRADASMQFKVMKEQLVASQKEVDELKAELSERLLPILGEEEQETGNFVRTRKIKRATPETYRNVFDLDMNGQRVLEHLTMVFCKDSFVPDGKGGERQTSYNLGAHGVVNFIVNQINRANDPNYKEEVND